LRIFSSFRRLFLIISSILIVAYTGFQVKQLFFTYKIETEMVTCVSISDSIEVQGLAVRNEILINKSEERETIAFVLENGESVGKDEVIAKIYESYEDVLNFNKISELQREIKKLKKLEDFKIFPNVTSDYIFGQIQDEVIKLQNLLNKKDYNKIFEKKEEILYLLNKKQIITGQDKIFSDKLENYEKELKNLNSKSKESISNITSPEPGVFLNFLDGFEENYNYNSILNITPEELKEEKIKKDYNKNSVIGKIVTDASWYLIFNLKNFDFKKLTEDMEVSIFLPRIYYKKIPGKIIKIVENGENSEALIICECNFLNKDLAKARREKIILELANYTGLKISKRAIHEKIIKKNDTEHKIPGVYVLRGGELVFKEVVPVYEKENFVICEQNPDLEKLSTKEKLQVFDYVVTKGKDLFDGKIIKQ